MQSEKLLGSGLWELHWTIPDEDTIQGLYKVTRNIAKEKNNFKIYMLNCSVFSLIMALIFVQPVLVQ